MATSGQFYWPLVGSSVAAYGQFGMAANTKAALEFAKLGFSVKEMIGGYEYWVREGQPTEDDAGTLPRTFDAQVMVVGAPISS